MARKKTKLCPSCHILFKGRSDAKTCSDRCRKRYQRAMLSFQKDISIQATLGTEPPQGAFQPAGRFVSYKKFTHTNLHGSLGGREEGVL